MPTRRKLLRSIQTKLTLAIISVSLLALLISFISVTIYDLQGFETAKRHEAQSLVNALSHDLVRLLAIGEIDIAVDINNRLEAFQEIHSATVRDLNDNILMRYGFESESKSSPSWVSVLFEDYYVLTLPIVYQQQTFGTIQLDMTTAKIKQEILQQLFMDIGIFLLVLILALVFAYFVQKRFTRPIIQLSKLIDTATHNYNLTGAIDAPMLDEMGKVHTGVKTMLDAVEQKSREIQLERDRLNVTLESLTDGVITTDHLGNITYLNSIAEHMTGLIKHKAIGRYLTDVLQLVNEASYLPYEGYLKRCLQEGQVIHEYDNVCLVNNDKSYVPIQLSISPINLGTKTNGCVIIFRNISEHRELSRKLLYQAKHDGLTGLLNRLEFERLLVKAISAIRPGHQHIFLYIDLDQFKIVNDLSGHIAGDALLKQVAHILSKHVRNTDSVSRFGGDEFGILLYECDVNKASRIANKIINDISQFTFIWEDNSFKIGASVGMVNINDEAMTVIEVLRNADTACYTAKDHGRNRVHVHQDDDSSHSLRQGELFWISRLNDAIRDENFALYLQRIFPVKTNNEAKKFEVLIRMYENDTSIVKPSAFLPSAERYGLIDYIDRWVIENLIRSDTFKNITMDHPGAQFNINLSGKSLNDTNLTSFIFDLFRRHQVYPRNICFEITETAAISNFSEAIKFAQAMRAIGCQIALDDFGSGLSSFAYLKNLPVDYLKIDGSFISDIDKSPINFAMVRSINELGQIMGIKTVAECVESQEALNRLKSISIDYVQGFYLHTPEPLVKRPATANIISLNKPRPSG